MGGLEMEGVVEWLRPLVKAKQWDYCVVWKLGDDPSRYIEWMGCCCGGGYDCVNVKEEKGEEHHWVPLCRDGFLEHPIRTKACEALAQLPSSMPLYSGIHTEVVISTQPRWLSHVNASDSNPSQSHDSTGTRVLIPVLGGLIELFATKNIPENQKMLQLFMDPFNVTLKQEANVSLNASASLNELHIDPLPKEYTPNWLPSMNLANFIPKPPQVFHSVTQSTSCPSLERSSSGSNPSSEHQSFDLNSALPQHVSLNCFEKTSRAKKPKCSDNLFKQQAGLVSGSDSVVEKDNAKVIRRTERQHFQSKNLVTERNRRNRIKDGLLALRALVPKITKMDRAAILGDAIDYIQELQEKVKELQDELKEIEEEDFTKNKVDVKILASDRRKEGSICLISTEHKQGSSRFVQKSPTEVHVEVNQIGKRDCLIKLFCEQNRGGFARLMENMDSLGLQVVDANVTTFNRNVLNILKVEANTAIQAKKLRDVLIQLTGETKSDIS